MHTPELKSSSVHLKKKKARVGEGIMIVVYNGGSHKVVKKVGFDLGVAVTFDEKDYWFDPFTFHHVSRHKNAVKTIPGSKI